MTPTPASQTPITDAAAFWTCSMCGDDTVVHVELSRKLERQLASVREENTSLHTDIDDYRDRAKELERQLTEARAEVEGLKEDGARYRFMRQNIDYTANEIDAGYYWHNQRGEFEFAIANDGSFPEFEAVIDNAIREAMQGESK